MLHEHLTNGSLSASTPDEKLLNALSECIAACNHCLGSCLHEKQLEQMITCIELNRDCAAACQLTFNFITATSKFTTESVKLCAAICAECAAECLKHPMDHCIACAEACTHCEQLCRDHLNHS